MALNINGTTGISGVDGSASAPSFTGTDSNTGFSFGSDIVNINTAGGTRLNVNAVGNVGIGTTTQAGVLHVKATGNDIVQYIESTTTASEICFRNNTSGDDDIRLGASGNNMTFDTNGSEKCRITQTGAFITAGTSAYSDGTHGEGKLQFNGKAGNHCGAAFVVDTAQDNFSAMIFKNPNGVVGVLRTHSNSVSLNSLSDYRLKENVVAISDGITKLKTLNPIRFNFKSNKGQTVDGFLAHEVTAVPEATTGTKDEVVTQELIDNKVVMQNAVIGEPIYQSIDQSKLIPLLTAALKEAVGKIEVLETKVAALEAA